MLDGNNPTLAKSWTNLSLGVPPISVSLISTKTFSVVSFALKYRSILVKKPPTLSVLKVWDNGSLLNAFAGNAVGGFLTTILSVYTVSFITPVSLKVSCAIFTLVALEFVLLVESLNVVGLTLNDVEGAGTASGFLMKIHPSRSPTTSDV